jgi:hypothetical protein
VHVFKEGMESSEAQRARTHTETQGPFCCRPGSRHFQFQESGSNDIAGHNPDISFHPGSSSSSRGQKSQLADSKLVSGQPCRDDRGDLNENEVLVLHLQGLICVMSDMWETRQRGKMEKATGSHLPEM